MATSNSISKLIDEAKAYKGIFAVALVAMSFGGIAGVLPSWLIKLSIDGLSAFEQGLEVVSILPKQLDPYAQQIGNFINPEFLSFNPANLHLILPISIVTVFILEAVFKFIYQYNSRNMGLLITKSLREKFHQHINKMSLEKQREFDSGSLVSVISSDLQSMQSWLAESVMNIFNESFKATFLFAWLLLLNWKLTVLAIVMIPCFALPVIKFGKNIRNYARSGQDYVGTVSSLASESIRNQTIVKAFNLESWSQNKFIKESDVLYGLYKKWILFMSLVSPVTNVLGAIGISSVLFFGLVSVKNGAFTVGEFSSFFVTSILLYDPVKRLGRVSTIVQSALGVADRVYDLLGQETQEDSAVQNFTKLPETIQGSLEFKNVDFAYEREEVFTGLSLKVEAKSSIALVGPSGGGKSTLVSLIPRFYEIDAGEILLDGINISEMKLSDLRDQIAIVTQEPLLFKGTIRENIALGTKNANEAQIQQAAEDSYVLEFAQDFEQGLDTDIGENGSKLSIGQKQRVSIARAFISDAPIIILDEPTSALDNESQEFIYKSIQKLMQTRTVIIIAHRLSTVESCDRIIYIQDGKILEDGTHKELIEKPGAFAALLN